MLSFQLTKGRTAYISFGGLLLVITGAYRHLAKLRAEDDLYCLCRR